MPLSISGIWYQLMVSSSLLRFRAARGCTIAGFVTLWIATILAPGKTSAWDWTRVLLVGVLTTVAILAATASRHPRLTRGTQRARLIGSFAMIVLAVIVSLTFNVASTAILLIGVMLLAMFAMGDVRGTSPWLFLTALVVVTPLWVWTAVGHWRGGLLLLIPLGALAILGDHHMHEAVRPSRPDNDPLSWRAHRLGSWLAVMIAALLVVIVGITISASHLWIILGALGAIVLIAIEVGLPRPESDPGTYAVPILDLAFLWLAFSWLVSLS